MGIRRMIQRRDGAAKPGQGQVQRGNTCDKSHIERAAVLFTAADAL